ncbi:MAG TPA: hypothetical protein VM076_07395 [Gemmatimonadaceae bacterium]|nr:hypothetical protein [Gemmatimonadaceae bacterium]
MRATLGKTLGILALAQIGVIQSAAVAQVNRGSQGMTLSACSILTTTEILQITKKQNRFNLRPQPSDEVKGVSECHFLDYDFSLVGNVTKESFEATRKSQAAAKGVRVDPAAGVGDDAFFWARPQGSNSVVGIIFRVGQRRLAIQDMVSADSIEIVKPTLMALAKAAAPKLK